MEADCVDNFTAQICICMQARMLPTLLMKGLSWWIYHWMMLHLQRACRGHDGGLH